MKISRLPRGSLVPTHIRKNKKEIFDVDDIIRFITYTGNYSVLARTTKEEYINYFVGKIINKRVADSFWPVSVVGTLYKYDILTYSYEYSEIYDSTTRMLLDTKRVNESCPVWKAIHMTLKDGEQTYDAAIVSKYNDVQLTIF